MTERHTEARDKAAEILALEPDTPRADVAERVGICRRTLYRWLEEPGFRLRIVSHREGLQELGALAASEMGLRVPEVVDAYIALAMSEDTPPEVRERALWKLLERFAPARPQEAAQGSGGSPVHVLVQNAISGPPGEREARLLEARREAGRITAEVYGLAEPVQLPEGIDDRPPAEGEG